MLQALKLPYALSSVKELKMRVFEGDLVLGDGVLLVAEEGAAEVKGSILCEGSFTAKGSLRAASLQAKGDVEVEGDLEVARRVKVEGDLYVQGGLKAHTVKVEGTCTVGDLLKAEEIFVGSILTSKEIEGGSVSVGGTLRSTRLKAERVSVGGILECEEIEAEKCSVGGTLQAASLKGGKVSVGGTAEAESVSVDEASVGGTLRMRSGSFKRLSVGGMLEAESTLAVSKFSVGGMAVIEGGILCDTASVGGALTIKGGGEVARELSVGGTLSSKGVLRVGSFNVGGLAEVEKVIASRVRVFRLRAGIGVQADDFELAERGRVEGLVVARSFKMEDGGSAEKVYAAYFECGDKCRVKELNAYRAVVGRNCSIWRINYVEELVLGEGSKAVSAEKVSELKLPEGFEMKIPSES